MPHIKQAILKIEQLIVQHLYNQKKVTLQGIGTISLNPAVALPSEGEKDFQMPDNAFSFEYNLKSGEDEPLINFIIQQTRKIRPLATADLESYSILSRQFLNIGKPMVIEGVGTIQKNQVGEYEFIPGHFITPKIEDQPKQVKDKAEEEISFESESRPNHRRRNMMIGFFISLAVLGSLGFYYLLEIRKSAPPVENEIVVVPLTDTVKATTIKTDSVKPTPADTTLTPISAKPLAVADTSGFKIVIKDYPTQLAANKAFTKLTEYGHKVVIIQEDSSLYHLAMLFNTPLADSGRTTDSLRKFFGGKPYVLKK